MHADTSTLLLPLLLAPILFLVSQWVWSAVEPRVSRALAERARMRMKRVRAERARRSANETATTPWHSE